MGPAPVCTYGELPTRSSSWWIQGPAGAGASSHLPQTVPTKDEVSGHLLLPWSLFSGTPSLVGASADVPTNPGGAWSAWLPQDNPMLGCLALGSPKESSLVSRREPRELECGGLSHGTKQPGWSHLLPGMPEEGPTPGHYSQGGAQLGAKMGRVAKHNPGMHRGSELLFALQSLSSSRHGPGGPCH